MSKIKQMNKNNVKQYTVKFGKSVSFGWKTFSRDSPFEISLEFNYYDNNTKKVEDLKEYISDLLNFSICPCTIRIANNQAEEKIPPSKKSLSFVDVDDSTLLSDLDLPNSFYVASLTNEECQCSKKYQQYLKYSKSDLIKLLCENNDDEDNEEDEEEENEEKNMNIINNYNEKKELKKKIHKIAAERSGLKEELEKTQKEKNDLTKKFENYNKQLKEKEKLLNDMDKQFQEKIESKSKEYDKEKSDLQGKIRILENNKNNSQKEIKKLEKENEKLKKENNKNKENINELNNNINNLNLEINNQKIRLEELKKENNKNKKLNEESDNSFKELKDERDNYKQMAENLQNEKLDLTKKIDEQNNENENLNKTISQLKKDKEFLTLGINKDITTLKKMHEMGLLTDIPIEKNSIIIDPKTNQIREANQEFDNKFKVLENFYDIIVDIKSVKDIEKGWEIKMTEKGEKNFMNFKDKELIRIGVIGNSNKGKSFILSRISKIDLPSGTSIKTEGLSIKYPELEGFKNREIALLDSAGLETPVLDEDRKVEEDEDEVKSINETNSGNANSKHEEITPNGETSSSNNEKKEGQNKDIFKEKSREKLITELFLQNYIINNSDILLLVVGILTYSEQKLLNKIKNVINSSKINKTLFIIHNLKTYTTKKQVQEYIKKYLKKSLTFELKKGHKISTKKEDSSGIYYFEKNSEPKIFHLIFANEGSEAGDYYNNFTLEFIEHYFQNVTDLKPFDIIQTVKEGFTRLSTDIIEQTGQKPFSIDDIISNEEILKTKKIKLKEYQDIVLKRCFIDELGFSNLKGNGFVPNYNYYQIDDKLILRIEAPGNIKCETKMDYSGECTVLRVSGNKLPDKEPKNNANLYSTREFGEFNVCVLLKTAEYQIANESPKLALKNGLLICEYKLDKGNGANKIELDDEV